MRFKSIAELMEYVEKEARKRVEEFKKRSKDRADLSC